MSGITLSSAVRQNLLSLQNTASLASVTQNRLATGKKVNSALDNPVNFFTASGSTAAPTTFRTCSIGIGNGVQALKAADTGITSLTNLINTAKSIANQALQAQIGYTTKSNVSTTIGGATSTDLRGTTTYTSATASSNVLYKGTAGGTTAAVSTSTLGGTIGAVAGSAVNDNAATPVAITTSTLIYGATGALTTGANTNFTDGTTLSVNGHTITFKSGAAPAAASAPTGYGVSGSIATDGNGNSTVYLGASGDHLDRDRRRCLERNRPRQRCGQRHRCLWHGDDRGRRHRYAILSDRLFDHGRRGHAEEFHRCRPLGRRQG